MSEDAAQYKAGEGARAPADDGLTHSAESMLEHLRVNTCALRAWMSPPSGTDSVTQGRWFAYISWAEHAGLLDCVVEATNDLTRIGGFSSKGGTPWEAVEMLARNIPGRREQIRKAIPELQKRLRALAKTI